MEQKRPTKHQCEYNGGGGISKIKQTNKQNYKKMSEGKPLWGKMHRLQLFCRGITTLISSSKMALKANGVRNVEYTFMFSLKVTKPAPYSERRF